MHACEVHAHEVHTHKAHAYEVHGHEVYARKAYGHEVHASEMHVYEAHAYEMHTCEIHAYEMQMTPIRYTPMRHMPVRCTPMGCTPIGYMLLRYMPVTCTPVRYTSPRSSLPVNMYEVYGNFGLLTTVLSRHNRIVPPDTSCKPYARIYSCSYYRVKHTDGPFPNLQTEKEYDEAGIYYVRLSATFLIFISSWPSSLGPLLVRFALALVAYPMARQSLRQARANNPQELPTPYQLALTLKFLEGAGFTALWAWVKYLANSRRKGVASGNYPSQRCKRHYGCSFAKVSEYIDLLGRSFLTETALWYSQQTHGCTYRQRL